jgi:hypothetical protein
MADLETPDGDAVEQQQTTADGGRQEEIGEVALEAPEADAVEQHTPVRGDERAPIASTTWEADEGDLAESAREVPLDDDDYR